MGIPTFNLRDVSVTYGGEVIEGFGDGDVVQVEFPEDEWVHKSGMDGAKMRSKNHDVSAVVTMTLQYGVPANLALTALIAIDRETGDGVLPLAILDANTGFEFAAASAYCENRVGQSLGNEPSDVEYRFRCTDVAWGHGVLTERGPF